MLFRRLAALSGIVLASLLLGSPANALTMAECSVKYNAAKDAGTLNGQTWNQFRRTQCGSDAAADESKAKKVSKSTASDGNTAKNAKKTAKSTAGTDAGAGGLTMAQCSAKYQAAKAAGTLNGMKWNDFRKSECGPGASATAAAKPAKKTAKSTAGADDGVGGLTMAQCSAKYQAAKAAGTLNGMRWNDFRKSECGPGASATAAAKPTKKPTKSTAGADDGAAGLTMAECSAKYQAAKAAGTLKGMRWNDFRKARCGARAADDDTVPSIDEASYTGEPERPVTNAPKGVKFPSAISRKYVGESPARARMRTCLEQYYANKDSGALGGLRWIQKGGGYYSLCNARLKG
jgi:hypothetical protein